MAAFGKSSRFFSSMKSGGERPPFEGIYIYIVAVLLGYIVADLGLLKYRPKMLPSELPPSRPIAVKRERVVSRDAYKVVTTRNLFNADGMIPPALTSGEQPGAAPGVDAAPVLSQLPLKLEGTIVHANPSRSVATITVQAKNETQAFLLEDEIEGLAKITKIERRRVIFRNLQTGHLEFIEIPKDSLITFGLKTGEKSDSDSEVAKEGEFEFTLRREDLNKYTSDLASILNQARMMPNIVPGSGGKVDGFRFVSIQPNSIYEKLGFKMNDVIKSVNDEPVNSPTKAMELYNALRTEARIQLKVERDGREENFQYNVKD